MEIIVFVVVITLAVISLVAYAILIVSGRQKRLANRVWEENRFTRAPYNTGRFTFEISEEITSENEQSKSEINFKDI